MEVANLVDMQERVMIVVKAAEAVVEAVVEVVDASLYLLLFFHLPLSLSRPCNSSHRISTPLMNCILLFSHLFVFLNHDMQATDS